MAIWPEADDELRRMWAEGLSTSRIGKALGVSKNAIVGRAHRLDLEQRQSPIRGSTSKASAPRSKNYRRLPAIYRAAKPPIVAVAAVLADSVTAEDRLRVTEFGAAEAVIESTAETESHAPVTPMKPAYTAPRDQSLCCYPIGEPGRPGFHFCGDKSLFGRPYCEEHAKLCFIKKPRSYDPDAAQARAEAKALDAIRARWVAA